MPLARAAAAAAVLLTAAAPGVSARELGGSANAAAACTLRTQGDAEVATLCNELILSLIHI